MGSSEARGRDGNKLELLVRRFRDNCTSYKYKLIHVKEI